MTPGEPYISLVVTARNDDHGGNLLRRQRRQFAGKLGCDLVPGDLGAAIGRQDGFIHVDQHRAG